MNVSVMGSPYWDGLKHSQLNLRNEARPWIPPRFERDLAALSREFNIPLRVVWMPDRERTEMIGFRGAKSGYRGKVYPTNPAINDRRHRGWYLVRGERVVCHYGPERLPKKFGQNAMVNHYDAERGEWWMMDWSDEPVAYSRWQVEFRLDSAQEKQDYEGRTFNPDTLELVQELGAMPVEGFWLPLGPFVAEHTPLCCDEANENFMLCPGKYREPGPADIEMIRQAIYCRNKDGYWEGVDKISDRAYQARIQQLADQEAKRRNYLREVYKMAFDEAMVGVIGQMTPKVTGTTKPLHTQKFNQKDVESLHDLRKYVEL